MNGCSASASEVFGISRRPLERTRDAADRRAPRDLCRDCAREWDSLRETQASLAGLGPVPEPEDLLLRIRVAVSQERARSGARSLQAWYLAWKNTVGPFLLQAGAGFASAVLLLGYGDRCWSPCLPSRRWRRPGRRAAGKCRRRRGCSISPAARAAATRLAPSTAPLSLRPTSTARARSTTTASSRVLPIRRPAPRSRICWCSAALSRRGSLASRCGAWPCCRFLAFPCAADLPCSRHFCLTG